MSALKLITSAMAVVPNRNPIDAMIAVAFNFMAGGLGLEPKTAGFKVRSSTN